MRTAQSPNESLGWTEVRHPFHPLRGQRYPVLKTRRVAGIENLAVGSLVVLDRNRAGIKAIIPTEIDRSTVSFSATYDQLNLKNGRLTYQLEAEVNQGTTDVRIGTVVRLPSAVWTAAPLLLLLSTLGIGGHANAGRRVL